MKDTVQINVTFPVAVEISAARQRQLDEAIGAICSDYEAAHPERIMWPAGIGGLPPPGWMFDEPKGEWDMSVLWIDVAARDRYPGERDNPSRRAVEQSGWLIERNDLGAPQWLRFGPGHRNTTFTTDASKALRFSRKEDADVFIIHHECSDPVLHATEHAWLDVPRKRVAASERDAQDVSRDSK